MNKGYEYEKIARKILEQKGLIFVESNIRSLFGEIDILMKKENIFYIIEVKYRKIFEQALYSITSNQMKKSLKTFYLYCEENNLSFDQIYYISFVTDGKKYRINIISNEIS